MMSLRWQCVLLVIVPIRVTQPLRAGPARSTSVRSDLPPQQRFLETRSGTRNPAISNKLIRSDVRLCATPTFDELGPPDETDMDATAQAERALEEAERALALVEQDLLSRPVINGFSTPGNTATPGEAAVKDEEAALRVKQGAKAAAIGGAALGAALGIAADIHLSQDMAIDFDAYAAPPVVLGIAMAVAASAVASDEESVIGGLVRTTFGGLGNAIAGGAKTAVNGAVEDTKALPGRIGVAIEDKAVEAVNEVKRTPENIKHVFVDAFARVVEKIVNTPKLVAQWQRNAFQGSINGIKAIPDDVAVPDSNPPLNVDATSLTTTEEEAKLRIRQDAVAAAIGGAALGGAAGIAMDVYLSQDMSIDFEAYAAPPAVLGAAIGAAAFAAASAEGGGVAGSIVRAALGEPTKAAGGAIADRVERGVNGAVESTSAIPGRMARAIEDSVGDTVNEVKLAPEKIKTVAVDVSARASERVANTSKVITGGTKNVIESGLKMFKGILGNLARMIEAVVGEVVDEAKDSSATLVERMKDTLREQAAERRRRALAVDRAEEGVAKTRDGDGSRQHQEGAGSSESLATTETEITVGAASERVTLEQRPRLEKQRTSAKEKHAEEGSKGLNKQRQTEMSKAENTDEVDLPVVDPKRADAEEQKRKAGELRKDAEKRMRDLAEQSAERKRHGDAVKAALKKNAEENKVEAESSKKADGVVSQSNERILDVSESVVETEGEAAGMSMDASAGAPPHSRTAAKEGQTEGGSTGLNTRQIEKASAVAHTKSKPENKEEVNRHAKVTREEKEKRKAEELRKRAEERRRARAEQAAERKRQADIARADAKKKSKGKKKALAEKAAERKLLADAARTAAKKQAAEKKRLLARQAAERKKQAPAARATAQKQTKEKNRDIAAETMKKKLHVDETRAAVPKQEGAERSADSKRLETAKSATQIKIEEQKKVVAKEATKGKLQTDAQGQAKEKKRRGFERVPDLNPRGEGHGETATMVGQLHAENKDRSVAEDVETRKRQADAMRAATSTPKQEEEKRKIVFEQSATRASDTKQIEAERTAKMMTKVTDEGEVRQIEQDDAVSGAAQEEAMEKKRLVQQIAKQSPERKRQDVATKTVAQIYAEEKAAADRIARKRARQKESIVRRQALQRAAERRRMEAASIADETRAEDKKMAIVKEASERQRRADEAKVADEGRDVYNERDLEVQHKEEIETKATAANNVSSNQSDDTSRRSETSRSQDEGKKPSENSILADPTSPFEARRKAFQQFRSGGKTRPDRWRLNP